MVRSNELSFARRGALQKLAARRQGARPGVLTGLLVGLDPDDDSRVVVSFDGSDVSVLAGPQKLVPGTVVAVEVDSSNAPVRVTGPVTTRPEGLDADMPAPAPVVPMPDLASFSPEDQAKVDQAVADIGEAQQAIADANDRIGALATTVGFAWSGSFDATFPVGSPARVVWTALGDGQVRFQMVDIPVGATVSWGISFPGGAFENYFTNPVVVTVDQPGTIGILASANDGEIDVEGFLDVRPEMMDSGPLQTAIADAAHAAMLASRIAPRSTRDPIPADGDDRPIGAVWTKINSEGEELAYWAWDGTMWVPQSLSTTVVPYLDAAHIRTGVLDTDRLNATEIWAQIATIGKIITAELIATGAVTANALNVVHVDPATGYGWRADPEGLTFLDQDGNPFIVMRADMANAFSVVQDGVIVASISPDGEIVGQSVSANENLLYRGVELEDRLVEPARGIIKQTRNGNAVTVGTSSSRLLAATFRTPATDRMVTVTVKGTPATGSPRLYYQLRQSTGDSVGPNNSLITDWFTAAYDTTSTESFEWSVSKPVSEWGWPYDATITVGLFVRSLDTGKSTLFAISSYDQAMVVRDDGPAVATETHTPWAPASGGGDGSGSEVQPGKRDYTAKWNANAHRTFPATGLRHVRADKSLVQGFIAGVHSTGHWYFPSTTGTLTGATDLTGTLTIRNEYTGSSSGMTIGLWAHNYASPQSSFGTASKIADVHVARGQTKTITLPASILNGIKAGTIKGFGLSHGSTTSINWYGYYSPTATLTINYKK